MHLLTSHDKKTLINLSQVQTISIIDLSKIKNSVDKHAAVDYEFQPLSNGEANYYREKFENMDDANKRLEQIQRINSFINVR